jgi:hypothetical protein
MLREVITAGLELPVSIAPAFGVELYRPIEEVSPLVGKTVNPPVSVPPASGR